ncbi:MAG TPA: DinB family protein [Ktedonobacteraceae bacterium]
MTTLENPFAKVRQKLVAARLEVMSQLAKFHHDELTQAPAPGEWSALQLAYHVYVADGLALEQMCQVQEEDNPLVEVLDEKTPRLTREGEPPTSLEAVLAGMAARREEIFEYLSVLAPEAWERPFRHPEWGQLKFYQLVNILALHDRAHAQQLAEVKAVIVLARS